MPFLGKQAFLVQAMRKRLPPPEPPTPKGGTTRPASAGCDAAPDRISPEDYVAQDEILKVLPHLSACLRCTELSFSLAALRRRNSTEEVPFVCFEHAYKLYEMSLLILQHCACR